MGLGLRRSLGFQPEVSNGPLIKPLIFSLLSFLVELSFRSVGAILPPRPARMLGRRAQRRSRPARDAPPEGLGLDGREHGGTLIAAGVRVLSEVDRLMLVSGVGASSFATTCEARRQPFDRGHLHRRPGRTGAGAGSRAGLGGGQAICGLPQLNSVPSLQMQCRMTASFLAMATFAFLMPMRLTRRCPHSASGDHRLVRWISTLAASNR